VSVPAKDKTNTERLWKNARDDQPFGGPDSPTAVFFHSRDWRATEPTPREPKIERPSVVVWLGYNRRWVASCAVCCSVPTARSSMGPPLD